MGAWEIGFDFVEDPRVPYSIKCLFDVQHHRTSVPFLLERLQYALNYPVALFGRSMAASEPKLVIRDQAGLIQYWQHSTQKYSFKYFGEDCQQTYRTIRG